MTPDRMDRLLQLRGLRVEAARAARLRADRDRAESAALVAAARAVREEADNAHAVATRHALDDVVDRPISGPALAAINHRIDQLAQTRDDAVRAHEIAQADLDAKTRQLAEMAARCERAAARHDSWAGECARVHRAQAARRDMALEDERIDEQSIRAGRH